MRNVKSVLVAGAVLACPASALSAQLFCPPHFVADGDQVVCGVANYGAPGPVTIRMRDGRNGQLVEDVLQQTLGKNRETGVHHNVVPPEGVAPAHPVICQITVPNTRTFRGAFARLAADAGRNGGDFEATDASNGGEALECR